MLNRRHLRVKVLQILYGFFQSEDQDTLKSEKVLFSSIEKMYDLYIYFMLTFEEMVNFAERRIEDRKNKVSPSHDDLHPNMKFVENQVFQTLMKNIELKRSSEVRKVNWVGAVKNDLMRKLFVTISKSETYLRYMETTDTTFEEDKEFAVKLFKTEIANFDLLHDYFENESIYWLDDIDLVCSMVLKTIKQMQHDSDANMELIPLYKDEDDERQFITTLFRTTLKNDKENDKLIDELTQNWDLDRIAKMDIILLKMAITELQALSSIPKKVTLNEYIEISKWYSTPKSQVFINGILDKAMELLEKDGKVKKSGRGLVN